MTEDVGGETSLSLGEDSKQSIVCLASFAAVGDTVVLVVTQRPILSLASVAGRRPSPSLSDLLLFVSIASD